MHQEVLLTDDASLLLPRRPWPFEPVRPLLKTALNGCLIPDSRLWQINEAWTLLEAATVHFLPSHIFLLFSGGYDSLTTCHLSIQLLNDTFRKYARNFGEKVPQVHVLHINTNIGVPQTREYVRNVALGYGWSYLEYTTPVSYEENVLSYGFPGPPQHTKMYILLKERALRLAIRDHTPPHPLELHRQDLYDLLNDMRGLPLLWQHALLRLVRRTLTNAIRAYRAELRPMLFITGARRQESARRMGTVQPLQKRGRQVWLSPLANWSKGQVLDYRDAYQLPHNLVADVLHKSGECLCGAFSKAGEMEELEAFFPEVGAYIKALEKRVWQAGFRWRWEERPPRSSTRPHPDQLLLPGFEPEDLGSDETSEEDAPTGFSPLCTSCNAQFEQRSASSPTPMPPSSCLWKP